MVDREKVIKGLECCSNSQNCSECPYFCFNAKCQDDMNKDALALLKEQETTIKAQQFVLNNACEKLKEQEATKHKTCERFVPDQRGWKYGAYQVNKLLQDVEYAKDILQGKQEQCSADYRMWETLNNISSFLKLFMDGNNTGK